MPIPSGVVFVSRSTLNLGWLFGFRTCERICLSILGAGSSSTLLMCLSMLEKFIVSTRGSQTPPQATTCDRSVAHFHFSCQLSHTSEVKKTLSAYETSA